LFQHTAEGAALALGLIYSFARRGGGVSTQTLLLAGVTLSIICGGGIMLLTYVSNPHQLIMIHRWLMGGVDVVGYRDLVTLLPFLLPGLGLKTGCTVLGLYLLGSLLICTCGLLLLRFQGAASHSNVFPDMAAVPLPSWPGWQTALTSGIKQFVRIAGIFVPCMLVIAMLLNLPLTRTTIEDLGGVLTQVGLAESSVVVVITALPSMMSGFATAIASIQQGVLSHQQIVPLIFLSAIGHALFSAFSPFLPTNMAIFGPQCGASLTFASLSIRLTCLVVVLSLALVL
ncbi:MAG: iron chelate uptake ABC transporter family permease subunit, partial [Desulfovibrionales bacterium]